MKQAEKIYVLLFKRNWNKKFVKISQIYCLVKFFSYNKTYFHYQNLKKGLLYYKNWKIISLSIHSQW